MAASNTDLVRNASPNFATTLANSMLSTDTSMTLQSATGAPTATGITLVIDATDPVSGLPTPNLKEVITGVVSGSTVTSLLRGLDTTTAIAHASGANVVMWITANLWNDFQTSYLTQHNQLGTHGAITAASISTSGTASFGGAATLASAVLNGSLTGTGLGSQVSSYTNTGSAGGTGYYINLSGIKLCWGLTGAWTASELGAATTTISLPSSFFSSIQLAIPSNITASASNDQLGAPYHASTPTITQLVIATPNQSSSNLTVYTYWFVTGT